MQVDLIRRRVMQRLEEAAASGHEDVLMSTLGHSRAVLLALAQWDDNEDVDLERVEVTTGTAARILELNQEYVRELARRGSFKATKENGEYRIPLSEVVALLERHSAFATLSLSAMSKAAQQIPPLALWQHSPQHGEGAA